MSQFWIGFLTGIWTGQFVLVLALFLYAQWKR